VLAIATFDSKCQKVLMTSLLLWLIFWELIGNHKIIIEFFEAIGISEQSLAKNLIELLDKYNFAIAYVKDENFKLHIMIRVLKLVVSCEFWV
jgi:hypothetical protein